VAYLKKLPCGCIAFGEGAAVSEEDRKVPILIDSDCKEHGIEATFRKTLEETEELLGLRRWRDGKG